MLNKNIIYVLYYINHINKKLNLILKSKIFIILDFTKGYHLMKLHKSFKKAIIYL